MVRAIPGRPTFKQIARQQLRGFAVRTLQELGDTINANPLQQLAANAGFTGDDVAIAAAVAMAESSGNPRIYNPETAAGTPSGKGSYGLWQIYLNAHPQFSGWNLYDPQTNANAAFRVWQQEGWRAWTTYKNGAYRKYLPAPSSPTGTPEPLTIDATTGQVVTDTMPTADATAESVLPPTSGTNVLLLTGIAVGAYLLADTLFGD